MAFIAILSAALLSHLMKMCVANCLVPDVQYRCDGENVTLIRFRPNDQRAPATGKAPIAATVEQNLPPDAGANTITPTGWRPNSSLTELR